MNCDIYRLYSGWLKCKITAASSALPPPHQLPDPVTGVSFPIPLHLPIPYVFVTKYSVPKYNDGVQHGLMHLFSRQLMPTCKHKPHHCAYAPRLSWAECRSYNCRMTFSYRVQDTLYNNTTTTTGNMMYVLCCSPTATHKNNFGREDHSTAHHRYQWTSIECMVAVYGATFRFGMSRVDYLHTALRLGLDH